MRASKFLARGRGYTLVLAAGEAVLALDRAAAGDAVIRMKVLGGDGKSPVTGADELPGKTNYLVGNDPAAWHVDVPSYAAVRYPSIYPGVDLVFHGSDQRELEYDLVIAPGADPAIIRLGFEGATGITVDGAGDLVLHAPGGDVVERAPQAYQEIDGRRLAVAAGYEIAGANQVAFSVGRYDRKRPLIIDPVLAFSTRTGIRSAMPGLSSAGRRSRCRIRRARRRRSRHRASVPAATRWSSSSSSTTAPRQARPTR